MRRLFMLATLGIICVVGAVAYLLESAEPPVPKLEMATPENTHGHLPSTVIQAHAGPYGPDPQGRVAPSGEIPPATGG